MRPPRTTSICGSFLIFGIVGLIMHQVVGANLCAHHGRVGMATILTAVLLVVSLRFAKEDKSDGQSLRRFISYVLVVLLSAGIWYEIWSLQACNTGERDDMVHQNQ